MAAVSADKIIDALTHKLAETILQQTIHEIAVQELEARVAELEDEASEPNDPERDSET